MLCIFGVLLVPLVDIVRRYKIKQKIFNDNDLSDVEKDKMIEFLKTNQGTEASLRNVKLLNYGLSVSAGSMIMTSIYKILPKSDKALGDIYISGGWVCGLIISFVLNYIIHAYTSESLVHCAHSHEGDDAEEEEHLVHNSPANHDHSPPPAANKHNNNASAKIKDHHSTHKDQPCDQPGLPRNKSAMLTDLCHNMTRQKSSSKLSSGPSASNLSESIKCLENTIGYDLKNIDHYRSMVFNKQHAKNTANPCDNTNESPLLIDSTGANYGSTPMTQNHSSEHHHSGVHPNFDDNGEDVAKHHHMLETPFSKLFSIGLQTCIALSLHKVPEGLILYFSNLRPEDESNSDHHNSTTASGSSIFIALAIHNFIEGFAMCLPIYSAFESKIKAVVLISILGGCTQPLGAFLGYLIHKMYMSHEGLQDHGLLHWISENSNMVNILLMSVTSGFLFVIALQMLQTAIGFSDSHNHDYKNKADPTDSSSDNSGSDELGNDLHNVDHTFGTNCVRWACFGAGLILLSGIFSK